MFEVARFEPVVEAVGACRRWVAGCLHGEVGPAVIADAELCVSELAANAVRHAATPFLVELDTAGSTLTVRVHDDDPRPPLVGEPRPDEATGRGLVIVAALASRWGWAPQLGAGKVVWFELAAPAG